jgi:hypothetical protein
MAPTTDGYWVANGLVLNTLAYGITTLGGREGIPPRVGENVTAGRRHGRRKVAKRFDQRVLSLAMFVVGRNEDGSASTAGPHEQWRSNIEKLKVALGAEDVYLEQYKRTAEGVIHLWTWAECSNTMPLEVQDKGGGGAAKIVIDMTMPDPLWYGDVQHGRLSAPIAADGLVFPVVFPITFGNEGSPGAATIRNTGTWRSDRLSLRINGPVTAPKVTHVDAQAELSFDIRLEEGDYLDVDMLDRTVTLNGTANRGGVLMPGSKWFGLEVGDNEIQFRAELGTGNVDVSWSSAYL